MSDDLPKGWVSVGLENHVYIAGRIGWRGLKRSEYTKSGPVFLAVRNILPNGQIDFTDTDHLSQERYDESPEIKLQEGDILLTKDGTIGKVGMVSSLPGPATVNSSILVVRPITGLLLRKYLFSFLRGPQFQAIAHERITGSAIPHLFQKDIKRLRAFVPPLAEQRRIVAKLEALLGRVDSIQERLERIPTLLKRFRQSVLAAACSGRLTTDYRGANAESNTETGLPASWELLNLGKLARSIRGGSTQVPMHDQTPCPILRSSSVRPFVIDYSDVRYLTAHQLERDENFLQEGDLLITRLSGSIDYVGNCALVRSLDGRRIQYPDRLFCCRLKDPAEAPFVELFFAGPSIRRQIENASRSAAGHQRISISDLQGFTIARPSIDEQGEVVRRVESLLALANQIESRFEKARIQIKKLTPSILAKAFRGELVPIEAELAELEDRDYESATALLERIRSTKSERSSKSGPQKHISKAAPTKIAPIRKLRREAVVKTRQ